MRKWLKRLAIGLTAVGGLLLVVALALPLVVRGKRLAGLVERVTAPLCGTIRIDGGRFAVTAIFDLLFGRPTLVELDGVRVLAPDGEEVLAAGRASVRLRFRRDPLELDAHDLRLRSVRWGFVEHRGGRVDFIDVFRAVPAGASREVCTAPPAARRPPRSAAPRPPGPPAAPRPRPSVALRLHDAIIEDLDLRLDFITWGLDLRGAAARGTLAFIGGPAGTRLTFEVREVAAQRGGDLRIGGRGGRWAAVIPFDQVQIDRFATPPDAPADMLLEVARATTGRSVLSGRARFTDVLWGRRSRWPGMELDARWKDAGDAVEALERVWGLSQRLPGRLDGDVTVRMKGPFNALAGRVQAVGRQAQLDLGLDADRRVDAALQVDDIETDGLLDRGLAPVFGGRLSGRIKARGQLASRMQDISASLDEVTLRLDRNRRGPLPRRFNVSTSAVPGPATADELDVFLKGARFARGTLSVPDLRASMPGATIRGALAAHLYDPETGRKLSPPVFDARTEARDLDLARLVPGGVVRGRLSFSTEQHGPADDIAAVVRFPAGSAVTVGNQTLALPARIPLRVLEGDRLVVPRLRLGHPSSGVFELGGRITFDGPVEGRLAILGYPLETLAAGARIPLAGRIDGEVRVTGDARAPRLAGQIALSGVRAGDTALGGGELRFTSERGGTAIEGRPIPALALRGRLSPGPRPALAATLELDRLPLDPFVADVPGLSGTLSGRADLRGQARTFSVDAAIDELALAYRVPRTTQALDLRNTRPVRLRATEREVVLEPAALSGRGIDLKASGTYAAGAVKAALEARLALPAFAELVRPFIKETAGVLDATVRVEGPARAPALSGELVVREPLRIWPAALIVPLQVPGGRVTFRDRLVEAKGLALSIASVGLQVDGRLHLDEGDLGRSRLDAELAGTVDGGALARRLPKLLEAAHGRATLRGRLGGSVAVPTFDGYADFIGFGATLPGGPVQLRSLDGRIEATGQILSTRSLTALLGPSGRLQIGTPEAPATVEVASLDPPRVPRLSARVRGQDLATAAPISGLQFRDLDLEVNVERTGEGPLLVSGEAWIHGATLLPREMRPRPGAAAPRLRAGTSRIARELFPEVRLDVGIHSPDGALEVVIPYLPDVSVTLDCRVQGPLRRPRVAGRARGDGLYSWLAIVLYDLFTDAHVRRCGAR